MWLDFGIRSKKIDSLSFGANCIYAREPVLDLVAIPLPRFSDVSFRSIMILVAEWLVEHLKFKVSCRLVGNV